MAILLVLGVGQNIVLASDTSKIMNLSKSRYIYDPSTGTYTAGNSYWLNTGSNHPIYQLVEKNESDEIIGISYYCLSADAGESWAGTNGNYATTVTYDTSYDLVEDKSVIAALSDTTYSGVINDYYDQIMWILDNMYIAEEDDGTDSNSNGTTDDVEELLEKAGIVYGSTININSDTLVDWHYNSDTREWEYGYTGYRVTYGDETLNIILEPEEIEAIQQAAIWYFTDYLINENDEYDCYYTSDSTNALATGAWFDYEENTTGDTDADEKIQKMKQEQAQILYNYFIESANSAGTYTGSSSSADVTIAYDNASTTITESGDNYVIGPMTITTTGTISSLVITTGSSYETTIDSSNITYQDSDGNTITSITSGESFSIIIPTSYVDSGVKVTVNTTASVTTKTLWTSSVQTEQPIVEVKRETVTDTASITATIEGEFDLALRKIITEINGVSTNILNESGYDATREITPSTSTIPDTATYYHRKDPVVVETSDVITYEITIYNEGDIAGYASKIVDQLATGLKMASTMGETVTSSKGNTYSVTYDDSSNQIVFEMTSSSPTSLSAFDGSTLDSDTIEVECEVTQEAATDGETTYYLTNIAYINEAYDSESGTTVTQDRGDESQPSVYPDESADDLNQTSQSNVYSGGTSKSLWNETDNSSDYFAGEEDDDDFETVVVMPKEFDLALRKFITSVSTDGSFDEDTTTTYSREPEVDTSTIEKTGTATYNHSKDPVEVSTGDYVLYTIRVYNEGDVDGYASEITDYLPEYLDFIDSTDEYISSINGQWTYDSETRTVTTTALAETLLKAYDGGSTLYYADVQIICKVNSDISDTTVLTNIAEISKYADEDGERETDRDSTADNLDYPDDPSTYQDDEIDSGDEYIPGQEDDDDFEKIYIVKGSYDLILIKEDEDGEQLNSTATFEVNGEEVSITGQLVIADGVEITKSNVGTDDVYTVKETVAPDGYCEFEGIITITVEKTKSDDETAYEVKSVTYTVADESGETLSTTDVDVYLSDDGNIYVEVINYESIFDLALRKFITNISGTEITTRIPEVSYDTESETITYEHTKDVITVVADSVVTYTIRVYNEGEIAGYAEEITDDIPEYLEYLPENETNVEYRWVMYDSEGNVTEDVDDAVKVVTDYTSKAYGEELMAEDESLTENPNLLNAFDPDAEISDDNPDYVDVQIAFKVLDPGNDDYIINYAQISEDADEDGEPVDDIDSIPDEWNDGEDDQDYENINVPRIHKGVGTVENQDSGYDTDEEHEWVITATLPDESAYNTTNLYKINDDINYKLTYVEDSVVVTIGETTLVEDTDYYVTYTKNETGIADETTSGTLSITFIDTENGIEASETLKNNPGETVTITFNTTYTTDDDGNIIAEPGEQIENTAEYENEYGTIISETPEVHYGGVTLIKYYVASDDSTGVLEGAVFGIYATEEDATNNTNVIQEATSDSEGIVRFEGLQYGENASDDENNLTEEGTYEYDADSASTIYYVAEIEAPTGYQKSDEIITVEMNSTSYVEEATEIVYSVYNEKLEFDLALLKYVTTVYVTEDGTTTTTKTGNTGADTDIIPKVEISKSKLDSTIVKFEFTIKITNEGDIAGYATEITDYVPEGLEFYEEDNEGWTDEGDNVISTTLLADTLLEPGESATVTVILRWINGSDNLGLKTNVAEISDDYNEYDIPDRDSTPDNQVDGEDDIDDAQVLLAIKTGLLGDAMPYIGGALAILLVLAGGIVLIRKYVL